MNPAEIVQFLGDHLPEVGLVVGLGVVYTGSVLASRRDRRYYGPHGTDPNPSEIRHMRQIDAPSSENSGSRAQRRRP